MMEVHVKLYASLRRYAPEQPLGEAFTCSLPEGATVEHLMTEVLHLPPDVVAIVLVNGIRSEPQHRLSAGDEVVLFPPMAGGSWILVIGDWLFSRRRVPSLLGLSEEVFATPQGREAVGFGKPLM
ncbi:MAG: MoaD/ThiS family protein [Anaerolineae bacterium]